MRKIKIVIFICLFPLLVNSQNLKNYVLQNTVEIKSINPSNENYTDLEPLKKVISDARVVMLGEQSHGDGLAFEAKTRIIKMLHEEMDFDVLVWESDFYGLNHSDEQTIDQTKSNIFYVWTNCKQVKGIFDYAKSIENSDNPLIFSGCDTRHYGLYTTKNYVNDFKKFLESIESFEFNDNYIKFENILKEVIENEYDSKATIEQQKFFYKVIDEIKHKLEMKKANNKLFWLQELENLNTYAFFSWKNNPKNPGISSEERDIQMGMNLKWLAEVKYPDKKIIFWAHNGHIIKKPELVEKKINHYPRAGHVFVEKSDVKTYILGFDSYEGNSKWASKPYYSEKIKSKKKSFEGYISKKEYNYAFINFENFQSNSEPFWMKGIHHFEEKSAWNKNYDGIFYIKNMEGCDAID